jgi:aspartyl-tRNA(Asn)/glutamyl-tRNA(Gln) amidotransferase subunit C
MEALSFKGDPTLLSKIWIRRNMSIKREEISKLASLARLSVDEETIADVTDRLSRVLALVDQLQSAETASIEISRPFHSAQRLREDEVTEINERDELQTTAPEIYNGLFAVPKMID